MAEECLEVAYSKIKPIRSRLDICLNYVIDPEKTSLSKALDYIEDANKTEKSVFVSAYNCSREDAVEAMLKTKRRLQRRNEKRKILGYHLIVSFSPGEVTPEEAHAYGRQLAEKLLADKYEVVISTHVDKKHIHNHIVFNSVSFVDGRMYRNNFKDYFGDIRGISDAICKEHGLSVIEPKEHGKHYAEWQAEQSGKTTIRSMIRKDVDAAIEKSFNYRSFLEAMRASGYIVKYGENVKHTAVKPRGGQRYIRLSSLGKGYTEADIQERLRKNRTYGDFRFHGKNRKNHNKIRLTGRFQKSRKITGIRALYWKYLYLLGKAKKKTGRRKVGPYLYDDVIRFEKYVKQNKFLSENRIDTTEDIEKLMSFFHGEIFRLQEERKTIGKEVSAL